MNSENIITINWPNFFTIGGIGVVMFGLIGFACMAISRLTNRAA